MYFALKGNRPKSKVVLEKVFTNEETNKKVKIEVVATRTREVVTFYEDGEAIGGLYISLRTINDDSGTAVQGWGNWQSYEQHVGVVQGRAVPKDKLDKLLPKAKELQEGYEMSSNQRARAVKTKGVKYEELSVDIDVDYSNYSRLEDYLYETIPMEELVEEKGISLEWRKKKDYRLIQTREDLMEFLDGLEKTDNLVGFDTETTGLLVGRSRKDILVGLSMSYEDHTGVYVPLRQERFDNLDVPFDEFIELLRPYICRTSDKRKRLVTHNGAFDWKVMRYYGIDLNITEDTFLRHGLMDIEESKGFGGLKPMASRYLGIDVVDLDDMYRSKTPIEIASLKRAVFEYGLEINPITKYKLERTEIFKGRGATLPYDFRFASQEFSELYGSADADFPRLVWKHQEKQWDNSLDIVYRLELETIRSLGMQEYWGLKTNLEGIEKLNQEAKERLEEIHEKIFELAGYELNLNSSSQKAEMLFDKMGAPFLPRFRTKKGGRGTGADVISYLSKIKDDDGNLKYPVTKYLKEESKLSKLISSFYDNMANIVHDGVMFPNYNQLGTATGRISSNSPNVQQMEATVRYNIEVDDKDEYYFMICDYSQVEYRVMGGLSGEPKVVDFFRTNPEADYHIQAYSNMHGVPYESVTSEQRGVGKTLNFGTTYGLEDENLANNLYGQTDEIHQQMAREAREQYFAGIPVLRDYFEAVRDKAEETGYVTTLFGRKRIIPEFRGKDINSLSEFDRASGRRKAGNTPVQGTSADIQKFAMLRVREIFKREGYSEEEARIVFNVHDEIGVHLHKSIHPYYALKLMREAMEMDFSKYGLPPLYIGAIIGTTWGAGQEDEREMPVMLMDEVVEKVEKEGIRENTDLTVEELEKQWQDAIEDFALRQIEGEKHEKELYEEWQLQEEGRVKTYSGYFPNPEGAVKLIHDKGYEAVKDNYKELLAEEPYVNYEFEMPELSPEEQVGEKGKELADLDEKKMVVNVLKHLPLKDNKLKIELEYPDSQFVRVLEQMLVPRHTHTAMMYKDDQEYIQVWINLGTNIEGKEPSYYYIRQRGLLSGMYKLLMYYMRVHLYGVGTYKGAGKKIAEVGDKLVNPY